MDGSVKIDEAVAKGAGEKKRSGESNVRSLTSFDGMLGLGPGYVL